MAKLYITEYSGQKDGLPNGLPLAEQAITFSTSTQSAALQTGTKFVRVHTDSLCSIAMGLNPTATTSTQRMIAGQTEYFGVAGGIKIAAVTNT